MINDLDEVQYAYLLAPTFQFVNSAGKPITGGWMEVYIHGTRNKYYCASDWDGTLHPFKIPLDSLGSNIVLASPAFAYDVYVYNRFGSLIMSRYNVIPVIGGGATGVVPVNISIESEDNTVDIEVSGNVYNLSISGTIDKLNTVSADVEELREAIATGLTQVQSDWEETDSSSPAYIQNKPDKVSLIAGDNIGIIPSGTDLIISASGVDTSDFATHSEVNNVSGSIITVVNSVSSTLDNKIDAVSSSIPVVTGFVTQAELTYASGSLANYTTQVSGSLQEQINQIPEQVNADWNATSGVAQILNKPDLSVYATNSDLQIVSAAIPNVSNFATKTEVNTVSGILENEIQAVSSAIPPQFSGYTSPSGTSYIDNTNFTIEQSNSAIDYVTTYDWRARWQFPISTVPVDNTGFTPSTKEIKFEVPYPISGEIRLANNYEMTDYISGYFNNSSEVIFNIPESWVGNLVYFYYNGDTSQYQMTGYTKDGNTTTTEAVRKLAWEDDIPTLIAGNNITITATGADYIISSTASGGSGINYQEGYGIDINNDTISVDTTVIPDVSAVSAMIDAASANDNLFIAEYGSTTFQAILDAVKSGKFVVCHRHYVLQEYYYPLAVIGTSTLKYCEFRFVYGTELKKASVNTSNTWYNSTESLQADWNETNSSLIGYIKNKPDLSVYTTSTQVSAIASAYASGGGGGSGVNYQAGDHIDITNNTISVTGITELVAGNAINITVEGDSAIISSNGEAQVQSDWNVTDSSSKAYIRNKPSIPAAQIQSDWNQTNTYSKDYIKNKPTIKNYTGASGVVVNDSTITLDEPLGIVAGSGINIVIEGDSAIICVSGVTGGGGSGTNYQAGTGINITNDTISVDTTVIPDVSAVQQMIATASGNDNLFIAEYQHTPRQDLLNAYNSGKYIICKVSGVSYIPLSFYDSTNQTFYFVKVDHHTTATDSYEWRGSYGLSIYQNNTGSRYYGWYGITYDLCSDWNETNIQSINYIRNKPDLSVYTTQAQVSAIVEAATGSIPTVQVNSDWNATSGVAEILNKPIEANLLPGSGITITASGSDYVINTTPIELVASLPANPVSGVLYLIPEA